MSHHRQIPLPRLFHNGQVYVGFEIAVDLYEVRAFSAKRIDQRTPAARRLRSNDTITPARISPIQQYASRHESRSDPVARGNFRAHTPDLGQ